MTTTHNVTRLINVMLLDQGIDIDISQVSLADAAVSQEEYAQLEAFLSKLNDDDLETFASGEQEDQMVVALKHLSSSDAEHMHAVADEIFMAIGC